MEVPTIKRKTEIYIEPSLLILNGVEERLDKPKLNIEITWIYIFNNIILPQKIEILDRLKFYRTFRKIILVCHLILFISK